MAQANEALELSSNSGGELTEDVSEVLGDFGLASVEVSVYQATLALGARPASTIARKAGLKRGHTYNVLQSLMEKGIVQEFLKNGVRHFTCSPPKTLLSIVDRRAEEIASQKERLLRVIPFLEQMRNPLSSQPKVRFFQGVEGIKEIYEDMIRVPGQPIYAVTDIAYSWTFVEGEAYEWLQNFISRRAERDVWWYGIMNLSPATDMALRTRKWIKREVRTVQNLDLRVEISVFGPKVAITSTHQEQIGVLIENDEIATTLRNMHQAAWHVLPEWKESRTTPL